MQNEIKGAAKYFLRWRGESARWRPFDEANRVDLASKGYGPTCPKKVLGRFVDGVFKLGWQCNGHKDQSPPPDVFPTHSANEEQKLEALTHYYIFHEVSQAFEEGRISELWSEANTIATPYMRSMAGRVLDRVYGRHDFTHNALGNLPYHPPGLRRKRRRIYGRPPASEQPTEAVRHARCTYEAACVTGRKPAPCTGVGPLSPYAAAIYHPTPGGSSASGLELLANDTTNT